MLRALLTDQIQKHAFGLYYAVREKSLTQKTMWANMQTTLDLLDVPDSKTLWQLITKPDDRPAMVTLIGSS